MSGKAKGNSGTQDMANLGILKKLQLETTCSFCLNYFKDPIILPCGHIFCHLCLVKYWGSFHTKFICPRCKVEIPEIYYKPSKQLATMVQLIGELSHQMDRRVREKICRKHQKALNYFCKQNQTLVCLVCDGSQEHQSHSVVPMGEAAQEYKNRFLHCIDCLKKERDEIQLHLTNIEKESQEMLKQTKVEREKTLSKYKQLRNFLSDHEHFLLEKIEMVAQAVMKRRDEQLVVLFEKLFSLNKIIKELENKYQQPAGELLHDIKSTMRRYEGREKFQSSMAYPPALKWEFWEVCDLNAFLVGVVKHFEDMLVSGYQLLKADVTLDPETAHSSLLVSDDRKTLISQGHSQVVVNLRKRFDQAPFALGCEEFTGGRHYWDAFVGKKEEWGIGVARKSVRRKGVILTRVEEGIWAVGKWGGRYMTLNSPGFDPLALRGELKRIRVTLNYDGGRLAFFDADRADLLYVFPIASFAGEPLHPFFWLQSKAKISLSPQGATLFP